jgi:hypothetical protein
MASTILSDNGVSSGSAGLKSSADSTGVLALQTSTTGGTATTAVTIGTNQYIGVGTTSTTYPLQIGTNPSASSNPMLVVNPATGTNGAILYFNNSGSGGLNIGRSDSAGAGSGTTITAYDSFVATTGTTGLSFHTNNTRAMYIDSGQNVGIGTTTPFTTLQVGARTGAGTTNPSTGSVLSVSKDGATGIDLGSNANANNVTGVINWINAYGVGNYNTARIDNYADGQANSGALRFWTASSASTPTERMRIDSSGNVGIGTTSPTSGKLVISGTSVTTSQGIRLVGDTADARFICESATLGAGILGTFSNHSQLFYTNSSERMRITSGGLVGIGTTSPQRKLTVIGADGASGLTEGNSRTSLFLDNSGANYINIAAGASNTLGLFFSSPSTSNLGAVIYDNSSNFLRFDTNSTERMRINSSGNLLIKCTANPSASVYGSAFLDNGVGASVLYQSTSITSANALQVFFNPNGNVGSVGTSGSNAYYSTTSDYRLKENITPMTGALEKVAQLKPVNYKWKADGSDGEGFIAHELAEVCPHAVVGDKDAVDADGNPIYQSIDTSFLVGVLTKAIQELKAINDTQAETINALTARVVALEGK